MKEMTADLRKKPSLGARFLDEMRRNYVLYIMAIPVVLYFFLFCYLPMFGIVVAFQDHNIRKGITGSDWVGLENFIHFFKNPEFFLILKNTVLISLYSIIFGFPAPIIFALLLNEIKNLKYKKIIQTVTYLPHFISMVVICSMIMRFFGYGGIITSLLNSILGANRTGYITDTAAFRSIYVGTDIWQGIGWGSIIYISALSSIDQELYEAAVIDGAGKWKQVVHITIPGILPTIVILFIMRMGSILTVGYEKLMLLRTADTDSIAKVISLYIYDRGIAGTGGVDYGLSSAVGIFSSIINILFLVITNKISTKLTDSGLF